MNVGTTTRMRGGILALVAALLMIPAVPAGTALAVVPTPPSTAIDVTAATGGTGISVDTSKYATSPAWTTLTGPELSGGSAGSFTDGTITLTAPTGFEFRSSGASFSLPSCGTSASIESTTGTSVTITLTGGASTGACGGTVTGLEVRPTANAAGLLSGNIALAASTGMSLSTSNGGALSTVHGTATQVGFTTQPGGAIAGSAFATQPIVAIQDQFANTVSTGADSTAGVSIAKKDASGGTLTCAAIAHATAGLATFTGCKLSAGVLGMRLEASSGTLTKATSARFDVSDTLVFLTSPSGATGGKAFTTQPVIEFRVGSSRSTSEGTLAVGLRIYTGPASSTLACTTNPVTAVQGRATFAGCKLDKAGSYLLEATSGTLLTGTRASLTVTVGPAAKLLFTTQPASPAPVGGTFPTAPVVGVTDAGGNVVPAATNSVTLSIGTNPAAGILTCTGGTTIPAVSGLAKFTGCSINAEGVGYTLRATATGLTEGTSNAFTVGKPAAPILLVASKNTVNFKAPLTLSITFSTLGATSGAYRTVALQRSYDNVNWTTIDTFVTDATGADSTTFTVKRTGYYRAWFAGLAGVYSPAGTTGILVGVRNQLALSPAPSATSRAIHQYWNFWLTAVVTPHSLTWPTATVTFRFYKYTGGKWKWIGDYNRTSAALTGIAKLKWNPSVKGNYYISVVVRNNGWNAQSYWSNKLYLRVY